MKYFRKYLQGDGYDDIDISVNTTHAHSQYVTRKLLHPCIFIHAGAYVYIPIDLGSHSYTCTVQHTLTHTLTHPLNQVHCDVHVFQWLISYIHNEKPAPVLDTNIAISILISSDFLQMGNLVIRLKKINIII